MRGMGARGGRSEGKRWKRSIYEIVNFFFFYRVCLHFRRRQHRRCRRRRRNFYFVLKTYKYNSRVINFFFYLGHDDS